MRSKRAPGAATPGWPPRASRAVRTAPGIGRRVPGTGDRVPETGGKGAPGGGAGSERPPPGPCRNPTTARRARGGLLRVVVVVVE